MGPSGGGGWLLRCSTLIVVGTEALWWCGGGPPPAAAACGGRRVVGRGSSELKLATAGDIRETTEEAYRSGFVAVVGSPNVGKSTLVNALVGERLCIATSKAQTTRQRIVGLVEGPWYQVALTDTPGVLHAPGYALQRSMVMAAKKACRDAEAVLLVLDIFETEEATEAVRAFVGALGDVPLVVAVNKVDLLRDADPETGLPQLGEAAMALVGSEEASLGRARDACPDARSIVPVSAKTGAGLDTLMDLVARLVPVSDPVFPPDQDGDPVLTDRPSRFFAAEMIREQILVHYSKEIPYACEVRIDAFREHLLPDILEIDATILVARDSQKAILIGKRGAAIKQVGIDARTNIQDFFQVPKVRLKLRVKVQSNWRQDTAALKRFGYLPD